VNYYCHGDKFFYLDTVVNFYESHSDSGLHIMSDCVSVVPRNTMGAMQLVLKMPFPLQVHALNVLNKVSPQTMESRKGMWKFTSS
jgi:hypothetical protein